MKKQEKAQQKKTDIELEVLKKIAEVLGVSPNRIKKLCKKDLEQTVSLRITAAKLGISPLVMARLSDEALAQSVSETQSILKMAPMVLY